ncbi:MAG: 4-hydroxy-tetrahydrodipicolinate reductase [Alphaproteobacteria bacterium]|nr:4-hydroxy-tetrahydrodipicolinate reductase [Alphaproteobacteria bacterium]
MKVCISGVSGRMGKEVKNLLMNNQFVGGISRQSKADEIEKLVKNSDVVIDFSSTENIMKIISLCAKYKTPVVCGTTGFTEPDFVKFKSYSKDTPILYASNFSIGIYQMAQLLKSTESILEDFDISIIDRHHNKKKDSPSGTTLFLASQLRKNPQIASLRIGGIPGDHVCYFTSDSEEICISHRSFNRTVFASGAIKCAKWIIDQVPGFYQMSDYVNKKSV